jgi:ketosteroid isomerase-like protein
MPELQVVERFVQLVESGRGIDAIDLFYANDVAVRENQRPPRVGRDALRVAETAARAEASDLRARCVRPILVTGDLVVIRWIFDYRDRQGRAVHFEELAYQRWRDDRIQEEQFFYDPAQFRVDT